MTVAANDCPPGWPDAFAAICQAHRGRLVRWLTAMFGARDAEDIAQEALTRLYVRPGLLDSEADAWPWLAVVARNVGRDLARHNAFTTAVDTGELDQLADGAGVHERAVARDDAERLALALRSISPRDRALIRLRDVDNISVADIAERLRMNDNAVRQQLFRAHKRLARAYLALGGDRRAGLVAVLGLKAREFLRRHGHLLNAFGPSSSGVLAMMAPAVAAIVGAALLALPGFAPSGAPHEIRASVARAAFERDVPTGSDRAREAAATAAARRRARAAAPRGPHHVLRQDYGPVSVKVTWHQGVLETREGPTQTVEADVYVPVVGYHHHEEIREWREGSGEAWFCQEIGGCRKHLPTPPPADTP